MDSYESPPSSSTGIPTMVWVIGALVVVCGCLSVLGVGLIGGYYYFAMAPLQGVSAQNVAVATVEVIAVQPVPSNGETVIITLEAGGETLDVEEHPSEGTNHTDEGDAVSYETDPPTSGTHYPVWAEPGFYDEAVDDGYLVHNLEHGYVIIWYDCDQIQDCDALQDQIIDLIAAWDGYKIIGMPRSGMDTPITLTSWTRLARMDEFNAALIDAFIEAFHNDAPEPSAP